MVCAVLATIAGAVHAQSPLYGMRDRRLTPATPRVAPVSLPEGTEQKLFVLATELSPAVLVHVPTSSVRLFANLRAWGLGAPTFCALLMGEEVRVLRRGETVRGDQQSQAWLLAWFAGSEGWNHWDAPMLIVLQRRPQEVRLDEEGLLLTFPKSGGDILIMPLYGYYKPPQRAQSAAFPKADAPLENVRTWEWATRLPEEVTERCRLFTQILRAFPVYAHETFAIEGDALTIRWQVRWRIVRDEWNTPVRKLAPLPPALGLAWWCGQRKLSEKPFPMSLSRPVYDPSVMTPYGPWLGVRDTDSFEARFPLLKYVHETEAPQMPDANARRMVRMALERLQRQLAEKFSTTDWERIWDHGGAENYCWQVMGDRWYAKALPYLPQEVRQRAAEVLRGYMQNYVLQERHYKPFREVLLLVGPGIGTWGGYDDAGKFSSNLLETLWCYAHFTGDWETVRSRWQTVKKFFVTPLECDWKSFGRYAIAELGDEAAPPLAMARLAYRLGDYDTYAFACYIFVRELVHHYVKQVGAEYFRLHQPMYSTETMPEEVYLTNLWGDVAGWQIDGPTYPEVTGERQFNNRWVRFGNEDVARFYREWLPGEIRREMDLLTERARAGQTPYLIREDTAHIAPSMVRLRSLLLNEPPEKLAQLALPDERRVSRSADVAAFCLSFIRSGISTRFVRLIPPQPRSDFVLGLSRAVEGGFPGIALAVETRAGGEGERKGAHFPVLRWWGWKPPRQAGALPGGEWWSFGQIIIPKATVREVRTLRLNWNTEAHLYEWDR